MGLIALDAGVMVGFLDSADPFHHSVLDALPEAHAAGQLLLPAVAYAESLVMVRRAGATEDWYRALLHRLAITIGTLRPVACERAAVLRSERLADRRRRQWRMPDALVVGEALASDARAIITTDANWPPIDEVVVRVLTPSG